MLESWTKNLNGTPAVKKVTLLWILVIMRNWCHHTSFGISMDSRILCARYDTCLKAKLPIYNCGVCLLSKHFKMCPNVLWMSHPSMEDVLILCTACPSSSTAKLNKEYNVLLTFKSCSRPFTLNLYSLRDLMYWHSSQPWGLPWPSVPAVTLWIPNHNTDTLHTSTQLSVRSFVFFPFLPRVQRKYKNSLSTSDIDKFQAMKRLRPI